LQAHGLESGGCPEELNESRPELIQAMARDYFEAGSDMVLTNSFGGNRFMLKKYGHGDRVRDFNRLAAQHARSAAGPEQYVVGSVGPTGEFVQPLGEVTEAEMLDVFVEQISALEEGGAAAAVIETMFALEESKLAIRAAKENTDLTVMATMTFDKGPRGLFTMMGVTPERAVKELREAGADIVGSNCGNGIEIMNEVAREMRQGTDTHLLVHSNAGIPAIVKGRIVYTETPEFMAPRFKAMADMGVSIIGGCCGTTPNHIRELSRALRG
jgi:5-methyltetrahydrofolate--homocysteine methyltransferase